MYTCSPHLHVRADIHQLYQGYDSNADAQTKARCDPRTILSAEADAHHAALCRSFGVLHQYQSYCCLKRPLSILSIPLCDIVLQTCCPQGTLRYSNTSVSTCCHHCALYHRCNDGAIQDLNPECESPIESRTLLARFGSSISESLVLFPKSF